MGEKGNILTLTPHKILPAINGASLGITSMHEYLGRLCQDHLIGTVNNGDDSQFAFQLHRIYPAHSLRHLPLYQIKRIVGIARRYDVKYIYCDHPYMAASALYLSKKLKIPWFLRAHCIESERYRTLGNKWWRFLKMYEGFAMRNAKGVLFVTPQDKRWAIVNYNLPEHVCHVIPYGTALNEIPEECPLARDYLARQYRLDPGKKWIYFLGAMNYLPNIEAVENILSEIVPRLETLCKDKYQILIAGKGLPEQLQQSIAVTSNVNYLGFLPEVDSFIKACDIMINPMLEGGGIKTKAVEALGYNKTVISTRYGAAGIIPEYCGDKLVICDDTNWNQFAHRLATSMKTPSGNIPEMFYDHYYWGKIAERVLNIMYHSATQLPVKT